MPRIQDIENNITRYEEAAFAELRESARRLREGADAIEREIGQMAALSDKERDFASFAERVEWANDAIRSAFHNISYSRINRAARRAEIERARLEELACVHCGQGREWEMHSPAADVDGHAFETKWGRP